MSDEEDCDILYVCKICRDCYIDKEDFAAHRKTKHPAVILTSAGNNETINLDDTLVASEHENEDEIKGGDPEPGSIIERQTVDAENVETKVSGIKLEGPRTRSMASRPTKNPKLTECATCELTSDSKRVKMVGCNSCTAYFHVECIGIDGGPVLKENQAFFCLRCAKENMEEESEDSSLEHETYTLRNMKKRRIARKYARKPEVHAPKNLPEGLGLNSNSSIEKFVFYECGHEKCGKLFISKLDFQKHYKNHNDGPLAADNCTVKIISVNSSDMACPLCPLSFNEKLEQIKHISSHAEDNRSLIFTDKEEFSLSIPFSSLDIASVKVSSKLGDSETVEISSNSFTSKNFNFSVDNFSAESPSLGNSRKRKIYPNPDFEESPKKSYDCTWCQKKCKDSKALTEHMGVHTGEKSLQCEYCFVYFRFTSGLLAHIRRRHPK